MKPIINIDQLKFESDGPEAPGFTATISDKIGAKKLGYNISVCPPGKSVCPFHNHRVNEELFFVLEGEGLLRFGAEQFPIRKGDFIACPPGGREVAHQMINTGSVDLKYLALSTKNREEVCEYPDSNKIGVFIGDYGNTELRHIAMADATVPYWAGETSDKLYK
jgi:uncharacterized cupin superfamily protein